MNFRFASPLAFLLLIPWALAAWRMLRHGRRAGVLFSGVARLPFRTAGWRVALSRAVPPLFLLGSLALIVAAARPQTWLERERRNVDAIAMVMAIDISGSMEALDLSPKSALGTDYQTRLDVTKTMFARFVERRADDLIGLVTFGGYASTRCPLTADHDALAQVLKAVAIPSQVDANGRPASQEELLTAIGDGLATACARLVDAEPESKVVVLLSDGVSNTGLVTPDQAAEAAAKLGIRVYAIGVGTDGPVPFRTRDMFGRETIAMGEVNFDEEQLKSISAATKGRYFNVRDNEGLKRALDEIDKLETTRVERHTYNQFNERYGGLLAVGGALILLACSLGMSLSQRPL